MRAEPVGGWDCRFICLATTIDLPVDVGMGASQYWRYESLAQTKICMGLQ